MNKSLFLKIVAVVCVASAHFTPAHAQNFSDDGRIDVTRAQATRSQEVVVSVRTLEARDPLPEAPRSVVEPVKLDEGIEDLRSKLRKLHFRTFHLIASHAQRVPLMQRENIPLAHGQTLVVRPLYIAGNRIGMWIKWKDGAGTDVLDTRMHFDSEESVITGTDSDFGDGIVLAINVRPN